MEYLNLARIPAYDELVQANVNLPQGTTWRIISMPDQKLSTLIRGLPVKKIHGKLNRDISSVVFAIQSANGRGRFGSFSGEVGGNRPGSRINQPVLRFANATTRVGHTGFE